MRKTTRSFLRLLAFTTVLFTHYFSLNAQTIHTVIGSSGDGKLATNAIISPAIDGIAADDSNNVYFIERSVGSIRKISRQGVLSTYISRVPNLLYLARDYRNNLYSSNGFDVKKIDSATGAVSTLISNHPSKIYAMATDRQGNLFYATLYQIRKLVIATGNITTIAGTTTRGFSGDGGLAVNALISGTQSITTDSLGNIYFFDEGNVRIRKINAATGIISTIAGNGNQSFAGGSGIALNMPLNPHARIQSDRDGNIFMVEDRFLRCVTTAGTLDQVATMPNPAGASMYQITRNRFGHIWVSTDNMIHRFAAGSLIYSAVGGMIPRYTGMGGPATTAQILSPTRLTVDKFGNIYTALLNGNVLKVTATTGNIDTLPIPGIIRGLAVDTAGNLYYSSGSTIQRRNATTGQVSIVAGILNTPGYSGDGGLATAAKVGETNTITVDIEGNLYLSDGNNNRIRKVTKSTGIITTVAGDGTSGYAGDGGLATSAKITFAGGMAVDRSGNLIFSDYMNHCLRKIDATTGFITTIAGNGQPAFSGDGGQSTASQLYFPSGVAINAIGDIFFSDNINNRIRKISETSGIINTIAGDDTLYFYGDNVPVQDAHLNSPGDMELDNLGNLFFVDESTNRVRKIRLSPAITGSVFYDVNSNGVKDATEQWANGVLVNISKTGFSRGISTINGRFAIETDTGTYTTQIANIPYYNIVPASKTSTLTDSYRLDTIQFALQPIPGQTDLSITAIPTVPARPGFQTSYRIFYRNIGTTPISNATVKFIKSSKVNIVSASPNYSTITVDTLKWNIPLINPHDSANIIIIAMVASPPAAINGEILHSKAIINVNGDVNTANDTFVLRQTVTGSYDPNDKTESHQGVISPVEIANGGYLNYTIRFQNTGTDTAFNVIVRDTLDSKLDWSSLEMIYASHHYRLVVNDGNKLAWEFYNILLPDSNINERASHGLISFRIKPKSSLQIGDIVRNKSDIYFDFNPPVVTNTAETQVKVPAPAPPAPVVDQLSFCSAVTTRKIKLTNRPASGPQINVVAYFVNTYLTIAADSTITLPTGLAAGSYPLTVDYSNETGSASAGFTVAITAAIEPDVDLSADKTTISSSAESISLQAANRTGGGTNPLYSFSKDRSFTTLIGTESSSNTMTINGDQLAEGDNWIYVRMKSNASCITVSQTIDSIKLNKTTVVTGIIDPAYPGSTIECYPNPVQDEINIRGLSNSKTYVISIFTATGIVVHQQKVSNSRTIRIPFAGFGKGGYWVSIFDSNQHKLMGTIPVIKQ